MIQTHVLSYLLYFVLLYLISVLYIKISSKYNISDKPNDRTSHYDVTPRGVGIIFPISLLIWFILYQKCYLFILGLLFISIISFIDDVFDLNQIVRLFSHILCVNIVIYDFIAFEYPLIYFLAVIMMLGWINGFNFMDGINGMTCLYSVVIMITIYFLNSNLNFIETSLLNFTLIPILVFSTFNFRNNAIAFCGDVGSISLAFIFSYIFLYLIISTGDISYLMLLSLYGVESSITIFERIIKKKNILKPHRTHLYQYLVNEKKVDHLIVSIIYALIQLLINIIIIKFIIISDNSIMLSLIFLVMIILFYIIIKYNVIKSISVKYE